MRTINFSFERFYKLVHAKMLKGRAEYGDVSFNRPPRELVQETCEEAIDQAGWPYILWLQSRGASSLEDPLRLLPQFLRAANYATVWPPPERMTPQRFAVWAAAMGRAVLAQAERIEWPVNETS